MSEPDQNDPRAQVVVIGADGRPIGTVPAADDDAQASMLAATHGLDGREGSMTGGAVDADVVSADVVNADVVNADEDDGGREVGEMVSEPAKVMRIGAMIKQLLDEVKAAPLDEASRNRLRQIHERSIHELEDGLSPELRDELHRLSLPFGENTTPSDAELRIAQAQLVGWLEGLFHGIQTTLFAQQMAARMQLEEMRRRALPAGSSGMSGQSPGQPGMPSYPGSGDGTGSGQYL